MALLALVVPSRAFATEEAGSTRTQPVTVVAVADRESASLSNKLLETVQAHLIDLPVVLKIEWVDTLGKSFHSAVRLAREAAYKSDAVTVFWVDLSSPLQMFLFLSHPRGERILVRDVGAGDKNDESRLETIAIIVRTSVEAILEGGTIGVEPPRAQKEEDAREPRGRLSLHVAYGLGPFADSALTHGPKFGLSTCILERWCLFGEYRLIIPQYYAREGVRLELRSHTIEVGVGAKWVWGEFQLMTDLAFLANYVSINATATDINLSAQKPSPDWQFGIGPSISLGWAIKEYATIFFAITLDIYVNQPEYVVESRPGYSEVVSPWSVRPFIQVGSAFGLL